MLPRKQVLKRASEIFIETQHIDLNIAYSRHRAVLHSSEWH